MTEESHSTTTVPSKWLQCNGRQLQKLTLASLFWLDKHHEYVNSLNVFPVPDGDTGTNMLLTMKSAYGRIQESDDLHVGKMAEKLAHGALMGARGNSGVILSQIWRGLAKGLKGKETFDAVDLARAFESAADTAYSGVMRPVEGTILTVIRDGANEATDAAEKSHDLRFMLERVLERSQQSLEKTPDLLPVLKQAGVVDSGGQGLVYIFEGMLRQVTGELGSLDETTDITHATPAQAFVVPENGQIENPYDVQFLLMGDNLNVTEVRNRIDAMGDSTVVVGDEKTIKVHIHVEDPGEPISYGITLGEITDVVIENMQMQMEEIVGDAPPVESVPTVDVEPWQIGVVAVAAGNGLANIFRSLGVASIVNGGQTNNPSTEQIFQAIEDVPTDKVIILPNNKNIILAAEAARDLSSKQVVVIPTCTTPQGLSAMLCHNPDGELEQIGVAMVDAVEDVATAEITRATRTVTLDGVKVNEGEIIGLVNGRLCVCNTNLDQLLADLFTEMELDECEIVTIYYGADTTATEAKQVAQKIETAYPDIETEILAGGQAHYCYILGAE